ncbi:HdeD family acid-resistance protein [Psychromarinibacter halotolerans]|uniref:HdeD family acid-resistance protein n=1 Tax=Psychromarinibacter halotolerans TaxID=1775175 RepID=A0ABV7GXG4_9RHOB|nr:HdeD family acid-resistance protein [Psychromarinibacter halotolerans]MDF0598265.1 HdeD family acid-resistance protein [Psychromarinibacter halotolerans]
MSDPLNDPGHQPGQPPEELLEAIRAHKGWFTFLGAALLIAGVVALLFPLVASIAAKVMVGWIMLVAGGINLWAAFQTRSWGSTIWNALIAVLSLAVGVYLAFFPMTGLVALTLLLGLTFAAQGVFEVLIGLQNRQTRGWGFLVLSGALSLVLGILLMFGLPSTAEWALGLMLGIHFVSSGISLLMLSRSV